MPGDPLQQATDATSSDPMGEVETGAEDDGKPPVIHSQIQPLSRIRSLCSPHVNVKGAASTLQLDLTSSSGSVGLQGQGRFPV